MHNFGNKKTSTGGPNKKENTSYANKKKKKCCEFVFAVLHFHMQKFELNI